MNSRSVFRTVVTVFVTALLLGTSAAFASHGPSITALAIDPQTPTTLYAGTSDRGVFKSVDAGASWSLTGLTGMPITSLAIDVQNPSTVYAGTQGGGVFRFKSADDGGTWVATNTGLPDPDVAVVMIDPLPETTLYALVPKAGLFKSTNSGDTWIPTLLNDDIAFPCCWYLPISATIYTLLSARALEPATAATLYAGVSYIALDYELEIVYWGEAVKSTDGGTSWAKITPQEWTLWSRILAVAPATPTDPAIVYSLRCCDYDLCWSSDDGATSTCARMPDTAALVSSIVGDAQNRQIIYAGTSLGVYKSEDHGASWKALNNGLTVTLEAYGVATSIQALAIVPLTSMTLYAGTDVGLFETTLGTEIWTPTGLFQRSALKSVIVDPSYVEGGDTSTGTVALVSAASQGGVTLALSSSDTSRATVPATVTVPAGATSTTFLVSTSPVTVSNEVVISAAVGDAERDARLGVSIPIRVHSVSLLPNARSGSTVTGSVYLTEIPMGSVVVALSSSDPAVAAVPASVIFTAGIDRTEFWVSTSSVALPTAVTISATYAGATKSFVLAVNPANFFDSLTLNPTSVRGGSDATGTVTLSAAALKPVMFQVVSRGTLASVPNLVTVPAGAASANFVVSTQSVYAYSSMQVQIGAYIIDGGSSPKYVMLDVTGPPIPLVAVGLNPAVLRGGSSSTAWVTIGAAAPAEGMTMMLSTSNTAVATVPATVTVPAGVTSAGATVLTNQVTASTDITISATSGGVTKSVVLTVNPVIDIAAPDTSVTVVVDGNGTPLRNGGATLSNVATIAFAGTDNVAAAGFECRLDGASFTWCSSPIRSEGRRYFEQSRRYAGAPHLVRRLAS